MVAEQEPKIHECHSDSECCDDHDHDHCDNHPTNRTKISRNEKKLRKAFLKQDLQHIATVNRVAVKGKKFLISVANPDVFKSTTSDVFVIFGDFKVEDFSMPQAANMARNTIPTPSAVTAAPVVADEEAVDETGVNASDINIVIEQANCSRAAAVRALKECGNDVVEAIMKCSA